jgi:hypothetical protein
MDENQRKNRFLIGIKIKKLNNSFIRDRWGSLTKCYWNEMIKKDILNLEKEYNKNEKS